MTPHEHYSDRAPWLRAAVLGANDGLVSVSSIMLGVGAGNVDLHTLVLSGLSALVAGARAPACSLAVPLAGAPRVRPANLALPAQAPCPWRAGEFISVRAQADTEEADVEKERAELSAGPEARARELDELVHMWAPARTGSARAWARAPPGGLRPPVLQLHGPGPGVRPGPAGGGRAQQEGRPAGARQGRAQHRHRRGAPLPLACWLAGRGWQSPLRQPLARAVLESVAGCALVHGLLHGRRRGAPPGRLLPEGPQGARPGRLPRAHSHPHAAAPGLWRPQVRLGSVLAASTVALVVFGAIGAYLGGAHKVRVPRPRLAAAAGPSRSALTGGPLPQLRASSRVLLGGWLAMAVTFGVGRLFGQGAA